MFLSADACLPVEKPASLNPESEDADSSGIIFLAIIYFLN